MAAAQLQWVVTGYALTQWPLMLIVARIIQGAAGAVVSPAALSLLTTSNPEGPARIRALSIWQATTAAGATAGIVAGGLLTQYLGWRAVFLVSPPLIFGLSNGQQYGFSAPVLAGLLVAVHIRSSDCQQELARQHQQPGVAASTAAEAQLRKC